MTAHEWIRDRDRAQDPDRWICQRCQTRAVQRSDSTMWIRTWPHASEESPTGESYELYTWPCDGERDDVDYRPSAAALERAGRRVREREAREEAYVLRAIGEVKAACLRGEVIPGADPDSLARYIGRELSEMTVQWAWDRLVARGEIVYCEEDAP